MRGFPLYEEVGSRTFGDYSASEAAPSYSARSSSKPRLPSMGEIVKALMVSVAELVQ